MRYQNRIFKMTGCALLAGLFASSAMAQEAKDPYTDFEGGPLWISNASESPGGVPSVGLGTPSLLSPMLFGPSGVAVTKSFKGVTQYDLTRLLGGSFIPPDTMGAVGKTQYMETTNGVYAIYDKATGAEQVKMRADTFWNNAGGAGFKNLNGDARVMYDAPSGKWIAIAFGNTVADIQIAVSDTSNAMGTWKATKFTGFAGGTADYPTLAIDKDAVYIGTNNFNSSNHFAGTTMNVISRADLLGSGAPTAASVKQFVTPYGSGPNVDGGYAIQGVNSTGPNSGMVMAASLFYNDTIRYNINNPGTAGATKGPLSYLGTADYGGDGLGGRQPNGTRDIDVFDQRISASVWEKNGKLYSVYGAQPVGGDHNEVRWVVTNAATGAIIQEGVINDPKFDYYQASLSVNSFGQVVIGYNRSGYDAADGNVSFMARTFNSNPDGTLYQTDEILLHVSPVNSYHNGSTEGNPAAGRQRWGDYSSVTLDPDNEKNFWVIGEYAETFNNTAGGHPGGSGGSRWGTWIADIDLTAQVPEPKSLALMLIGLLAFGLALSRKTNRV